MKRREIDRVVYALADARRRRTAGILRDHGTLTLADLADEVAARQHGVRLPEVSADAVRDVYLGLYHRDVPRLEAADVVSYDQERDVVTWLDTEASSLAVALLEWAADRRAETG